MMMVFALSYCQRTVRLTILDPGIVNPHDAYWFFTLNRNRTVSLLPHRGVCCLFTHFIGLHLPWAQSLDWSGINLAK